MPNATTEHIGNCCCDSCPGGRRACFELTYLKTGLPAAGVLCELLNGLTVTDSGYTDAAGLWCSSTHLGGWTRARITVAGTTITCPISLGSTGDDESGPVAIPPGPGAPLIRVTPPTGCARYVSQVQNYADYLDGLYHLDICAAIPATSTCPLTWPGTVRAGDGVTCQGYVKGCTTFDFDCGDLDVALELVPFWPDYVPAQCAPNSRCPTDPAFPDPVGFGGYDPDARGIKRALTVTLVGGDPDIFGSFEGDNAVEQVGLNGAGACPLTWTTGCLDQPAGKVYCSITTLCPDGLDKSDFLSGKLDLTLCDGPTRPGDPPDTIGHVRFRRYFCPACGPRGGYGCNCTTPGTTPGAYATMGDGITDTTPNDLWIPVSGTVGSPHTMLSGSATVYVLTGTPNAYGVCILTWSPVLVSVTIEEA
jgi:hypothetical protein